MQYCVDCNMKMVEVLGFSREKNEKFARCSKCYSKTEHRKIDEKELSFGEILEKTIKNLKERN